MKAPLALYVIAGVLLGTGCRDVQWGDVLFGPSKVTEARPQPSPPPSVPAPVPTPEPEPSVEPDPGGGAHYPPNGNPVAMVTARVFFIECNGVPVFGTEYATEAPVGCRLHLDCTPRDAAHQPTRASGGPTWSLDNPSLVSGGSRHDYTPVFLIERAGPLTAQVVIDGVTSNQVVVRFH